MSIVENEFEQLMERVRSGCPEAAREIFNRYSNEIQLVVRRRLSQRLRSQFDSLDFTQDTWASFFHIPADRYTFRTPEELMSFLSRIAYRKMIDVYRQRRRTLKHSRHQVQALRTRTDDDPGNEPPGPSPTPSQLAIAEEQWDRLLKGQLPEVRRALEMLRLGHSHREIADCLGVHPKMIQRVLQNLHGRLTAS
ncbi:MAG TPA: RNA polymerase sigma factor [Gemmataceae bacterium]|nr:RNA polymerase sigma factor [Gemmataceae bacterium]